MFGIFNDMVPTSNNIKKGQFIMIILAYISGFARIMRKAGANSCTDDAREMRITEIKRNEWLSAALSYWRTY